MPRHYFASAGVGSGARVRGISPADKIGDGSAACTRTQPSKEDRKFVAPDPYAFKHSYPNRKYTYDQEEYESEVNEYRQVLHNRQDVEVDPRDTRGMSHDAAFGEKQNQNSNRRARSSSNSKKYFRNTNTFAPARPWNERFHDL